MATSQIGGRGQHRARVDRATGRLCAAAACALIGTLRATSLPSFIVSGVRHEASRVKATFGRARWQQTTALSIQPPSCTVLGTAVSATAAFLALVGSVQIPRCGTMVSRRSRGGQQSGREGSSDLTGKVGAKHQVTELQSAVGSPNAVAPASSSLEAGLETAREEDEEDSWRINLLFDGDCPTCMKQVEFLHKRMDENPEYAGLIRFTNLADPDYDAESGGGVAFEDGMRHIHAVTRDGQVFTGMEVFRQVYQMVGMEWVYTVTTLPFMGAFFDWLYDVWAEHRLVLAGRQDIIDRIKEHQQKIQDLSLEECEVECEIDWDEVSG